MTIDEVTTGQFAEWSFERDQRMGLYDGESVTWSTVPEDERQLYLEEAKYYINEHPRDDWPTDIMERLTP